VKLRTVGLAAGGVAAAIVAERLLVGRPRRRLDPAVVAAFTFPDDAVHHDVPVSDGGSLHVVERGSGRPLVLLHGITLSSRAWIYQFTDLASERHRLLAVDHRGHGLSTPGTGDWDLTRLATDLAELLEALDLEDAVVVGHSMGGMVALRFALDHADVVRRRVRGLVLMSTSGGPVHRLAAWDAVTEALAAPAKRALVLGERLPGGLFAENDLSYLIFRLGLGRDPRPEHIELNRLMTADTKAAAWGELLPGVVGFDVRGRLDEIDLPALVMVGTRDLLTPPSSARALVAGLPRAEPLAAFPGAGHMLMLERREAVAEHLDRFASVLA
jgi:pimeloyl-ACP methyl ester carboxylesterase